MTKTIVAIATLLVACSSPPKVIVTPMMDAKAIQVFCLKQ